jgi:prophage regulatory protein
MAQTILRLPAVKARVGLSRSSIYLLISEQAFPKPISLGPRAVGWVSDDIDAWVASRIAQSRAPGRAHHGMSRQGTRQAKPR